MIHSDSEFNIITVTDEDGTATQNTIVASRPVVLTQGDGALENSFQVPKDADLFVSGDVVEIHGKLDIGPRHVLIQCRHLVARALRPEPPSIQTCGGPGDSGVAMPVREPSGAPGGAGWAPCEPIKGGPPKSGGPGQTPGKGEPAAKGNEGHFGGAGGQIRIICDSYTFDTPLQLIAEGGKGGNGAKGQAGGHGGPGGPGADGEGSCGFLGFGHRNPTRGGNGGDGQDGGPGGRPGAGGSGGVVYVDLTGKLKPGQNAEKDFSVSVVPGPNGEGGEGGDAGNRGAPGSGGEGYYYYENSRAGGPYGDTLTVRKKTADAADGDYGKQGNEGAKNKEGPPTAPQVGTAIVHDAGNPVACAAFVRHGSLEMILQRARASLLAGSLQSDETKYRTAAVLLNWLKRTCLALSKLDKHAEFANAILSTIEGLIGRMRSGISFFGHEQGYAPLASVAFYAERMDQSIATFKDLEIAHDAYFSALKEKKETLAHLQTVNTQIERHIAILKKRIEEAHGSIDNCVDLINKLDWDRVSTEAKFLARLEHDFTAAVEKDLGISKQNVINVLQQLAFCASEPGANQAAMLLSQAGALETEMDDDIVDAGGHQVKKDLVTHKVDILGEDFESLAEGYKVLDTSIQVDDPNAHKLLVIESKLETVLNDFVGKLAEASKAKTALHAYVRTVTDRNAQILRYNALWASIKEMAGRIAAYELQEKRNQALMAQNASPGLPEMSAFVASAFARAQEECLSDLNLAFLATQFWSLNVSKSFSDVLGLGQINQFTGEVVEDSRAQILSLLKDAIESRGHPTQSFPPKGHVVSPIRLELLRVDEPTFFEDLDGEAGAIFTVPVAYPDTALDESPFAGLADVRLTRIRVWLDGAKTEDGVLRLIVRRKSGETIVSPAGVALNFSHGDRSLSYEFHTRIPKGKLPKNSEKLEAALAEHVSGGGIEIDGDMSVEEDGDGLSKSIFAKIGPFAAWQIEAPKKLNPGLDLSNVDRAILEFHGNCYAFDA